MSQRTLMDLGAPEAGATDEKELTYQWIKRPDQIQNSPAFQDLEQAVTGIEMLLRETGR